MSDEPLLWPDDVRAPSSRDGLIARLGGRQLYFASRDVLLERPGLFDQNRAAITRHILETGSDELVELMTHNIDPIIARRPYSVGEKLSRVLRALASHADYQVREFDLTITGLNPLPYDLCRAAGLSGVGELMTLLIYASEIGQLSLKRWHGGAEVTTTIPGLMSVQESDLDPAPSLTGFVAMWFGSEMNLAYSEGLRPAIEANGFEASRVDTREHNNKIDDEIISEIRRARFVVADFSCGPEGARGGVYFEAGFALALDKPVIFTVRASDLSRVHFDTRQFNHIVWETPEGLREGLTHRIGATIGRAQ
jgi:hypothetical protein